MNIKVAAFTVSKKSINTRTVSTKISRAGKYLVNSLPARDKLCRLLIIFVNSLDPDQARQNVGPDLNFNCLTR